MATQEQLSETGTRLANIDEEKNGKTISLSLDLLDDAINMTNSLLLL